MLLPLLLHPEGVNKRSALHDGRAVIPVADANLHREGKGHDVALVPSAAQTHCLAGLRSLICHLTVYHNLCIRAPLRNTEIKRETCVLDLL